MLSNEVVDADVFLFLALGRDVDSSMSPCHYRGEVQVHLRADSEREQKLMSEM